MDNQNKEITIKPDFIGNKIISDTWWGQSWCQNIMNYTRDSNRLERGRIYARSGAVKEIKVSDSKIVAKVTNDRGKDYTTHFECKLHVNYISRKKVNSILEHPEEFLDFNSNTVSENYKYVFSNEQLGLFPSNNEITATCDCMDYYENHKMCKHIIATLYIFGNLLDKNPFLLFEFRGIDTSVVSDKLLKQEVKNIYSDKISNRKIDDNLANSLFGVEFDENALNGFDIKSLFDEEEPKEEIEVLEIDNNERQSYLDVPEIISTIPVQSDIHIPISNIQEHQKNENLLLTNSKKDDNNQENSLQSNNTNQQISNININDEINIEFNLNIESNLPINQLPNDKTDNEKSINDKESDLVSNKLISNQQTDDNINNVQTFNSTNIIESTAKKERNKKIINIVKYFFAFGFFCLGLTTGYHTFSYIGILLGISILPIVQEKILKETKFKIIVPIIIFLFFAFNIPPYLTVTVTEDSNLRKVLSNEETSIYSVYVSNILIRDENYNMVDIKKTNTDYIKKLFDEIDYSFRNNHDEYDGGNYKIIKCRNIKRYIITSKNKEISNHYCNSKIDD